MTDHAVFDALEATNDEAFFLRFVEVLLAERREVETLAYAAAATSESAKAKCGDHRTSAHHPDGLCTSTNTATRPRS